MFLISKEQIYSFKMNPQHLETSNSKMSENKIKVMKSEKKRDIQRRNFNSNSEEIR